jgi:hypothetical protein
MKQKIVLLFFILAVCGCGSMHNTLIPFTPYTHMDVKAGWAPHAKTTAWWYVTGYVKSLAAITKLTLKNKQVIL